MSLTHGTFDSESDDLGEQMTTITLETQIARGARFVPHLNREKVLGYLLVPLTCGAILKFILMTTGLKLVSESELWYERFLLIGANGKAYQNIEPVLAVEFLEENFSKSNPERLMIGLVARHASGLKYYFYDLWANQELVHPRLQGESDIFVGGKLVEPAPSKIQSFFRGVSTLLQIQNPVVPPSSLETTIKNLCCGLVCVVTQQTESSEACILNLKTGHTIARLALPALLPTQSYSVN